MEDLNSSWSTFTKGTASSGAVKMKILKYRVICKKWSMYTCSICTASYPLLAQIFLYAEFGVSRDYGKGDFAFS